MNRVALFPQGGHVFLRKGNKLDAGLLGRFNLIDFLLHGFLADLCADFMHNFFEGLLQVGRQGIEPGLVENPDEKPLGVVHVGEVFCVFEFLGDIADRRGVIQAGNDTLLQGNRNVRPWHDDGVESPLLIDQLVDCGFSRAEFDFLCVRKVSHRVNRGPAVIAVTGDVEADDPLMIHGHHKMIEDLPTGNELVEFFKRIDEKWAG